MTNKEEAEEKIQSSFEIVTLIIIIVIALGIIIFALYSSKKTDTYKIADDFTDKYYNFSFVENNKDKLKYSYIENVLIYPEEMDNGNDDSNYVISIEKYNTSLEAQLKYEYIKKRITALKDTYNNSYAKEKTDVKKLFETTEDLIFIEGNYLIIIDHRYKNEYNTYKKLLLKILKNYDTTDLKEAPDKNKISKYWDNILKKDKEQYIKNKNEIIKEANKMILDYIDKLNKCSVEKCESIINEIESYKKYSDLNESIIKVQNKYNEILKTRENNVKLINDKITEVETNLNQDKYNEVKADINNLTDEYYNQYRDGWNSRLESIKINVYKNSCNRYSYTEVLRNPDNYKGSRAYWFGVISQKISNNQFRVGIDCTKYHYIDGYSCKNTIYMYYYGETNLLEDDVVNLWGYMNGTTTYQTVLGSSLTIPTFNAEYVQLQ